MDMITNENYSCINTKQMNKLSFVVLLILIKIVVDMDNRMEIMKAIDIIKNINLEKELLIKGVTKEHIDYIKNVKVQCLSELYKYYDKDTSIKQIETLVSPKKIVDIGRANPNESLYDCANGTSSTRNDNRADLNCFSMAIALKHIVNDTLNDIYRWYAEYCDPIKLVYFSDDDVYQVGCDGNHRSLYALIVDAPKVRAIVTTYKKNSKKYKAHLRWAQLSKEYNISYGLLEESIIFKGEHSEYKVKGYTLPEKFNSYCEDSIQKLELELASDFQILIHKKLILLSKRYSFAKKHFLKFFCNTQLQRQRIIQHINNIEI